MSLSVITSVPPTRRARPAPPMAKVNYSRNSSKPPKPLDWAQRCVSTNPAAWTSANTAQPSSYTPTPSGTATSNPPTPPKSSPSILSPDVPSPGFDWPRSASIPRPARTGVEETARLRGLTNRPGAETIGELHPARVGLWRSWERASMAWKRSSVRSRSGPPNTK